MKKNIDDLTAEAIFLNKKRLTIPANTPRWFTNKTRVEKLLNRIAKLKQAARLRPLMQIKGQTHFHVLTHDDLEIIWEMAGVKRPLVRANLASAKYSFKSKGTKTITIYFDVFPSCIAYCTNKLR